MTPEPLGKGNKPVSLCVLECPVVGQRWPFNLPQCIEVTSSTGLQGRRTEQSNVTPLLAAFVYSALI